MNIKVNTGHLLAKLQANKEIHIAEYKEAYTLYLKALKESLLKMVSTIDEERHPDLSEIYRLLRPQEHTKEYDLAIKMLAWHKEDTITLTNEQYQAYIEDEWQWTIDFRNTSKAYGGNPKGL